MTQKKNKVAWITGGGTGIGKELALILAKQEYDVIISGRRKEKLIETANINKKKIHKFIFTDRIIRSIIKYIF